MKALLYWVKEEAKINPFEQGFLILTDSSSLNKIMVEITNFENYEVNHLYEFKHNSITQATISTSKEVKVNYLNLSPEI